MQTMLYVHAKGGAPLSQVIPRVASRAKVHLLALMPLPDHAPEKWRPHCVGITDLSGSGLRGDALVDEITMRAREIGADAVMTLSEYAILAVAHAARQLGLPGPGSNTLRARDKWAMRSVWADAGLPVPGFRAVTSVDDLYAALAELNGPVLLKSAWGAGSVGQHIVRTPQDVPVAWKASQAALAEDRAAGYVELYEERAHEAFIAEEIIQASTEGWYTEPGHGDYLSVEGVVVNGRCHPLAITGRFPTIGAFTELGNTAPSALPEHLQRTVEQASIAAVDVLELDTCGTHTEIKLQADGGHVLVETAARFGGALTTTLVHDVYGFDPVVALTDVLLGQPVQLPPRMLTAADATSAAASLLVLPATADGTPWTSTPIWQPHRLERITLRSAQSRLEVVPELSLPAGSAIPAYQPTRAALNIVATAHLVAADPVTLLAEARHVLDTAEAALGGS